MSEQKMLNLEPLQKKNWQIVANLQFEFEKYLAINLRLCVFIEHFRRIYKHFQNEENKVVLHMWSFFSQSTTKDILVNIHGILEYIKNPRTDVAPMYGKFSLPMKLGYYHWSMSLLHAPGAHCWPPHFGVTC
jgi:hypothetical protein